MSFLLTLKISLGGFSRTKLMFTLHGLLNQKVGFFTIGLMLKQNYRKRFGNIALPVQTKNQTGYKKQLSGNDTVLQKRETKTTGTDSYSRASIGIE